MMGCVEGLSRGVGGKRRCRRETECTLGASLYRMGWGRGVVALNAKKAVSVVRGGPRAAARASWPSRKTMYCWLGRWRARRWTVGYIWCMGSMRRR